MLNKKHSDETKQKIQAKLLGRCWKPVRLCLICGEDGVRPGRKYCSEECYGISRKGIITWMKGKTHTDKSRSKISKSHKGKTPHNYGKPNYKGRGENCHLWKGGLTKEGVRIRTSIEYKNWRRLVFSRDNFTCQDCGKRGGEKHAHHIKDFATNPELRFDVSNGITLCPECHKKTDNYPKNLH